MNNYKRSERRSNWAAFLLWITTIAVIFAVGSSCTVSNYYIITPPVDEPEPTEQEIQLDAWQGRVIHHDRKVTKR